MLGSCVFLIVYNRIQPEHQTKRGEIDIFRTISPCGIGIRDRDCLKRICFPGHWHPQKHSDIGNSGSFSDRKLISFGLSKPFHEVDLNLQWRTGAESGTITLKEQLWWVCVRGCLLVGTRLCQAVKDYAPPSLQILTLTHTLPCSAARQASPCMISWTCRWPRYGETEKL